jgi:Ca2+-binding RTX toxin-like protein
MATNIGTNKGETLKGKAFADKLFGKGGNDRLFGNDGNDTLNGGSIVKLKGSKKVIPDNDKLTGDRAGGEFKDTFVFGAKSGKDTVTDFDVKRDLLQIKKGLNGIKVAADVLKHAEKAGDDVVIDLGGGNTIKLLNVKISQLSDNPDKHFKIV